jgi:hypothetical protein
MQMLRSLVGMALWFGLASLRLHAATLLVWTDSPSPASPFESWAAAAHTIQEAVDAAQAGDTVLVTNGVYDIGGRAVRSEQLVNRVAIDRPINVLSVSGPAFTAIEGLKVFSFFGDGTGDGAVRCVYLADGAVLSGFTLTNGATRDVVNSTFREASGGGIWCDSAKALITNCVLTGSSARGSGGGARGGTLSRCALVGNSAGNSGWGVYFATLDGCTLTGNRSANTAGGAHEAALSQCTLSDNFAYASGGGAADSTLDNCALSNNSVTPDYGWGGGAHRSTLNSCVITGNVAKSGGGAFQGTLNNCIVYYNTAPDYPNWDSSCALNYCCTTPLPTNGFGNLTNDPALMDLAGGDLRLAPGSPCINAGNNSYATSATDLDGNPRIVSGTVDIGAYEYQGPGSRIAYAWLQRYGLPTDGSADAADPDHDGLDNWREWLADTDPTRAESCLRQVILSNGPPAVAALSTSVARLYTLQCATNLNAPAADSPWVPVPGQIDNPGTGGQLTLTSANPPAQAFYRVVARFR